MPARVLLGAVIAAHGTKGEVRVKTFTIAPENLKSYGPLQTDDGRELLIVSLRAIKPDEAVVRFDGIATRNEAERLKGRQLLVPRSALPEPPADEFYHADLIGLPVEDKGGTALGRVRAIHNFGASDVLEIEHEGGATEFLPFTSSVVLEIDVGKRIVIEPQRYEED